MQNVDPGAHPRRPLSLATWQLEIMSHAPYWSSRHISVKTHPQSRPGKQLVPSWHPGYPNNPSDLTFLLKALIVCAKTCLLEDYHSSCPVTFFIYFYYVYLTSYIYIYGSTSSQAWSKCSLHKNTTQAKASVLTQIFQYEEIAYPKKWF